jgi:hypothetical protein
VVFRGHSTRFIAGLIGTASLEFSESAERTDDDDGALHPLSAIEHYARLFNFPSISITS